MSLPERARPEPVVVRNTQIAGQVCLVTVAALTSAVVAGWTFRLRWLAALFDRSHPMKLNPAVAMLAYSCVVLTWRSHPRSVIAARTAKLVGVMVAALGLVTLAEYAFGISLGIDEMFREDRWSVGGLAPGRAAPQAAVILIALGVALALPNRMRRLRDGLIVASMAAALFAVLGELARVNTFVVIEGTYGLPLEASVLYILVALGLVLTSPAADTTLSLVMADSPGGVLLRRFITALAVPALVGAILYALVVGSRALDERSAGWLVTVGALTTALVLGWRAAITVDDLDDARTAEHDRLRAIVDALPFKITVFNRAGETVDVDLGAAKLQHIERSRSDTLVDAALTGRRDHLAWTDTTGNTMRSMEADGVPITRNTQITGALTVVRDVTELADAKNRYQALFDTIPEGLYEIALDGSLLVANDPLARLLGFADAESLMAEVADVRLIWAEPAELGEVLQRIKGGVTSGTTDARFQRRNGEVIVVDLSFQVMRDPSGAATGLRGTARDVTAERDAARRAADADERFRVAFNSGPLGRLVLDLRDSAPRFVEVNVTLASLLGYSVEELLRVDPISLIHPDDVTREFDACAADPITGDRTIDYESRRRHRDGNWIPVRLTGESIVDPSGAPRYAMVSIDDLRVKLATSAALEAIRQLALQQAAMAIATADMARHTLTDTVAADVLSFAAAKLVEILSADIAAIYTPGPTGELSLIAQSGVEIGLLATAALGASTETVVTDCVQNGATIVVDDWTQQPSRPAPPFVAAQGARSGLVVPLNGSDGCGGAIVVASVAPRAFGDEEIAFVEGLAQLVCLAQHTARANAQLVRSERTLTAFVENAPAAVSLLDDQGRYVLVNREAERVMGAARSAILGRYRADFPVYARRAAGEQESELAAADARGSTTFEESINLDDGDHSYISVQFPLIDDAGDLFGVGGISTDITPLKRLQAEADRAWRETTRRLAIAVEFRDEETGAHIDRMAAYCELIAVHLGLGADYAAMIRRAAPLHDAGKIAVPDRILLKPGTLTSAELKVMRSHAEIGYQLLMGTGSPELDVAASIAWTHHERIDGTGYPRQLSGEDIPIEGRIAAVADVFDALTSERVYHKAVSIETAAGYLRDRRGTSFDSAIVDALVEHLDEADRFRLLYADEHQRPQPYGLPVTSNAAPPLASRDDQA